MYEFNEDRWNQQKSRTDQSESGQWNAAVGGWLVCQAESTEGDRFPPKRRRFLQIGTGQWCSAEYATLFPIRSAAIVYAKTFGYTIGDDVTIVHHRF